MSDEKHPTLTPTTQAGSVSDRQYLLVVRDDSSWVVPLPGHGALVIGRAVEADVRLDDAACSRRHAILHVTGQGLDLEDLESHNGTRLNGRPISGTVAVESGDVIAIGRVVIVVHAPPTTRASILVDPAALRDRCAQEIERAVRYGRPIALVAIGLRAAVERAAVLRAVAPAMRPFDLAAPSHPGELLVLLPEVEDAAAELAAQLVAALARLDGEVRAGVSSCPRDGCRADALIAAARGALAIAGPGGVQVAAERDPALQVGDRSVLVVEPAMLHLYQLVRRLAATDLPVLVSGETGVGKENVAYALHAWSSRAHQPFVAINCAALPEGLVESELFGHERGAFTGATARKLGLLEAAHGGTVFFDEIGELPLAAQAKLLRVLENEQLLRVGGVQERSIDVRCVAATHRMLPQDVEAGRFRRDLLYRIMGATITVPPLRDRPCEIAVLAQAFLDQARSSASHPPAVLSAAAMDVCTRYPWPGNIRELKNEMAYVAATADDIVVEPWHLSERLACPAPAPDDPGDARRAAAPGPCFRPIADELRELERERMLQALAAAGHVQKRAAELIAMPCRTFRMKAKQYGLDPSWR